MNENTPTVLDYHHPDDEQFSLHHVTDDQDRHRRRLDNLEADETLDVRSRTETVARSSVWLIYTNDAPDQALPDLDTDAEIAQWLRDRFDRETLPIVLAVFRAYRGILEEKADRDTELQLYKQMQLEKLSDIVDRVEWGQSVPDVGAALLSRFILAHPMPNTNHRTGISLLDRYLTSIDPEFEMPDTGEEGEWYPWVADFIHDSKRILTLRRKLRVFRYAAGVGYDQVRRKEGVTIDLHTIDLDRDDPFEYYTDRHLERTQTFVDGVLTQGEVAGLREREDPGKTVFVDRLRADQ